MKQTRSSEALLQAFSAQDFFSLFGRFFLSPCIYVFSIVSVRVGGECWVGAVLGGPDRDVSAAPVIL